MYPSRNKIYDSNMGVNKNIFEGKAMSKFDFDLYFLCTFQGNSTIISQVFSKNIIDIFRIALLFDL